MKYSYEYKRMCVDLYRRGQWPETPPGAKEKKFHDMIREWVRIEDACGPEALQSRSQNREWTPDQKYELVAKVLAGASIKETAIRAGINNAKVCASFANRRMRPASAHSTISISSATPA